MWSATRWETFHMMNVWAGDKMAEKGIRNPIDLHRFPWEKEINTGPEITEEEAAEMQKEMENWTEFLQQQKSGN